MRFKDVSIIVPTWNDQDAILPLVHRIDITARVHNIRYEIIFVDDRSTDSTREAIKSLLQQFPISLYIKRGKKGKTASLIKGFLYAKYDILCMIDADLRYPPESIPDMLEKIENGADIVVANRDIKDTNFKRKLMSETYHSFFGNIMHKLDCDVQSGFKVFRREVIQRFPITPTAGALDLEFLINARNAGYVIDTEEIVFSPRHKNGEKIGFSRASFQTGWNVLKLKFLRSDIIPFHPDMEKAKGKGFHYKGREFIHHSNLQNAQSSFHRLSGIQMVILTGMVLLLAEWLLFDWHTTIVILLAGLTFLYFVDLLFNLYLIHRSFSKPAEIQISSDEIDAVHEMDWPTYTVFCPLYKEWQVIPQFVTAMSELDYPKEKLQIMLLLEEDDTETIQKIKHYDLPAYFDIVVVPHSLPKTKPKACNYGLLHATGEYTVIYDAEDAPDPLQLKKAVLAFRKSDPRTICVQAKLNFYNPHQNILTRVFTAEYSLWFDLVLTGLQSIHAPIPLGGTSNHFRTADLHKLKGWDSFNVTEDCDLGMRLVKQGYQTAVIDSTTLEEANSGVKNWFWQRTRWIKGYMQTYLLHTRDLREFFYDWREPHAITFQLVVGGKIMSMFINPVMWFVTICYFAFRLHVATFIESFFPTPVLYMGVFSLLVGNFLYMYYYMIGCAKHGHHDLIKYVIFVPFYWLAMSVAAWVAFYKLIVAPHQWSKTKHGLHLQNKKVMNSLSDKPRENPMKGGFLESAPMIFNR